MYRNENRDWQNILNLATIQRGIITACKYDIKANLCIITIILLRPLALLATLIIPPAPGRGRLQLWTTLAWLKSPGQFPTPKRYVQNGRSSCRPAWSPNNSPA